VKFRVLSNPSEIKKKAWNNFNYKHPNRYFFQSSEINDFYKSPPGYKPILIFCLDYQDNICGVLLAVILKENGCIKSKLSNRCIIYGGPVVNNLNQKVVDWLLTEFIKIVQNQSIYIEFRNLFDLIYL